MLNFDQENELIVSQTMEHLVKSLKLAVNYSFMSREHGAAIWKNYLKITGFDVPKKIPEKKE